MTFAAAASTVRARAAADDRWPVILLGLGAAPVLAVNGGYFSTSWGWPGMLLAWGAVLGAAVKAQVRPSRAELAFVGGLAAFALWLAVSMAWTSSPTNTALEVERTLIYVAAALAVLTLVPREQVRTLLGALCGAMTLICLYGLATWLFPDRFHSADAFAGARLASPVGYWNGLGLVAAMASLLALTFAASATTRVARVLAGAALPLLLATLYFTFSRGASAALIVGLCVLVAADRRRLQLVALALPLGVISAFVVWRASQATALTHTGDSAAAAAHDGHRVAAIVLVACIAAGYVALTSAWTERVATLPVVRRRAPWAAGALALVLLILVFARFGAPWTIAHHAYRSFNSNISTQTNLNNRLFTFSSNGRLPAWRVAVHAFEGHPVGGIGAGAFEQYWNLHRPDFFTIQDAHSLYVETLAETGIVGLALLLVALLAPFAAFRRARQEPLAAAALAAYSAYLVHAIVDWDWELSGVTLSALLCGGALLAAGRPDVPAGRWRLLPLFLASVVALAALLGLAGNFTLSASGKSLRSGNFRHAASLAERAELLAPWSSAPWERLGNAQLGLRQRGQALASFQTAVKNNPGDWHLWIDVARASTGYTRRFALAKAQQLNPRDPTIIQTARQLILGGTR